MSAQILRLVLPLRGPRLAADLAAIAANWTLLPINALAAAIDGYREAQKAVLHV